MENDNARTKIQEKVLEGGLGVTWGLFIPDDKRVTFEQLSSIPRTHIVEGRNHLLQVVL